MKRAAAALLALFSGGAQAEGFVDVSLGAAWRDLDRDKPFDQLTLEFDTGTLARIELGTLYESGLMLRALYSYTAYDELTAGNGLAILEDVAQQEARLGVFRATPRGIPLGWRLGAGYDYVDEEPALGESRYQRGGFVEAAAIVETKRATYDFAAALLKLGGDGAHDAESGELRAAAAFHTSAMDFTIGARYARIEREDFADERVLELRVGVGGLWAYPEGASY
jgi:hypothetical protein